MGVALTVLASLGAVIGAVAIGLLKDEVSAWLPKLNRVLVALAVKRLPVDKQGRYREEWLAHIEEYPGKIAQLFQSAKILNASWEMLASQDDMQVRRLMTVVGVTMFNASVVTLATIFSPGFTTYYQVEFWVLIVCIVVSLWCMYRYMKMIPWVFGRLFKRR